jgi:hypothetical protein
MKMVQHASNLTGDVFCEPSDRDQIHNRGTLQTSMMALQQHTALVSVVRVFGTAGRMI